MNSEINQDLYVIHNASIMLAENYALDFARMHVASLGKSILDTFHHTANVRNDIAFRGVEPYQYEDDTLKHAKPATLIEVHENVDNALRIDVTVIMPRYMLAANRFEIEGILGNIQQVADDVVQQLQTLCDKFSADDAS